MPSDLKPLKPKAEGHGLALLVQWANEPVSETVNQQHSNQDNQGQSQCYQFRLNLPKLQGRALTHIDPTLLPMI